MDTLDYEGEDRDDESEGALAACPICGESYDPEGGDEGLPRCGHLVAYSDDVNGFEGPVSGHGWDHFPPLLEDEPDSEVVDRRARAAFRDDTDLAREIYVDGWSYSGELTPLYVRVGERYGVVTDDFSGTSAMGWSASFWFCEDAPAAATDIAAAAKRLNSVIADHRLSEPS